VGRKSYYFRLYFISSAILVSYKLLLKVECVHRTEGAVYKCMHLLIDVLGFFTFLMENSYWSKKFRTALCVAHIFANLRKNLK
jgi:hypothetical protein